MTAALLEPPAVEPLSLPDIRRHLRLDAVDEDETYLLDLVRAARVHAENAAGRRFVRQRWRRYADRAERIALRLGPVDRVEAVTLFDAAGRASAAAPEEWRLHDETLLLDRTARARAANGVEIDLVCGYGDAPADVPAPLRQAVAMLVAHWHEFRGAVAPDDQPVSLPPGFRALLAPFRRVTL